VRNAERAHIANDGGAALMVRLHCDVGSGTGFTLYFPDRQGTAEGRTGPTRAVMERSRRAALVLDSAMAAELAPRYLRDGGVLGDSRTAIGSRQGALTGSIFSRVPVVTVEMPCSPTWAMRASSPRRADSGGWPTRSPPESRALSRAPYLPRPSSAFAPLPSSTARDLPGATDLRCCSPVLYHTLPQTAIWYILAALLGLRRPKAEDATPVVSASADP
jgi:hypothetical protein